MTDKRKSKLYGGTEPFNRIRKLLMMEVRQHTLCVFDGHTHQATV